MKTFPCAIERLESRIAPSSLIIGVPPQSATYSDIDGDSVTVKVSSGTLTAGLFTFLSVGTNDQLQKLDLTGASFGHEDVTFSVAKKGAGDGLVSVGYIDSTGHDLGKLTIKGNLDQLDVGDATESDGSMKSLTATSLGRYAVSGSAFNFTGGLGALTVASDVREVSISVQAMNLADAKLGSVTIGGSLVGGAGSFSGAIVAKGQIGPVKIGRDMIGGTGGDSAFVRSLSVGITSVSIGGSLYGGNGGDSGEFLAAGVIGPVSIKGSLIGRDGAGSGLISAGSSITSVTIGGSLIGGNGTTLSGEIDSAAVLGPVKIGGDVIGGLAMFSGYLKGGSGITSLTIAGSLVGGGGAGSGSAFANFDFGKTKIGKDLRGGAGANSGQLKSGADLADTSVGGSVIGGSGNFSGEIVAGGNLPSLAIKGSLIGGGVKGAASLDESGYVQAKHIGKVTIGGSVISGEDQSTGTLTKSGSIRAVDDIASLTIKGSLIGNASIAGDSPVIISARGQATAGTTDLAIGNLSIGGSVSHALILAGFGVNVNALNGGAQIGAVSVGGDWIASSLSAGVQNLGTDGMAGGTGTDADNINFGDLHDLHINVGSAITASIASIQIKGLVIGSGAADDHFGFVAQEIKSFKASGITAAIIAGANGDTIPLSLPTGDVTLRETM